MMATIPIDLDQKQPDIGWGQDAYPAVCGRAFTFCPCPPEKTRL